MQIALNIIIFFLGFSAAILVAVRPTKFRSDIDDFLAKLRYVTNGFKPGKGGLHLEEAGRTHGLESGNEAADEDGNAHLYTKGQIEEQFDMDTWQRLAYEEFKSTILAKGAGSKTFPCVYATQGYRSDDHRYIFLHSDDSSEPRNVRIIAPALRAYLRMSYTLGPNTSLVIMAAPSEKPKSLEEYNQCFWDTLRGLRVSDSKAWPDDIPQETDSSDWMFCFDGMPLFPVALTPAHSKRWSRHSPVPIIALQPKWVLDKLLATPEKRDSATGKVRKLLREYDAVSPSPDLTQYGQPGTSEVRQLCLLDENQTADCPYEDFDR